MNDLTSLPNLGKELVQRLHEVGVNTVLELKQMGSEQAFLRLRAIDPCACFNMLCSLEGAIQGVRWHNLSSERKQELKQFLKMIN